MPQAQTFTDVQPISQSFTDVTPIAPPPAAGPHIDMHEQKYLFGDESTGSLSERIGDRIESNLNPAKLAHAISHLIEAAPHALEGEARLSNVPKAVGKALSPYKDPANVLGDVATGVITGAASGAKLPPDEAPVASAAATARPAAGSSISNQAVRTAIDMAGDKVLAGIHPALPLAKRILQMVRRAPTETAPVAAPPPAPVPQTNGVPWGSVGEGPLALRGKMIPVADPAVTSPVRTMPGMHSPEAVGAPTPNTAAPIPARQGLMLQGEVEEPAAATEPAKPAVTGNVENKLAKILKSQNTAKEALAGLETPDLLNIAKKRELNVAIESKMEPVAAKKMLVNKILDDFSPEEMTSVKSVLKKAQKAIAKARPVADDEDLTGILQNSLELARQKRAAAQAIAP